MCLELKTAQVLSKNGQETGTSLLCNFISRRSFVDRTNHKEGFLSQNNRSSDSELSDFSESCSLVPNVIRTFWPRDSRTIFESKSCYKIANFFQTRFKLWNSVFKMLNFQNIEKLISLHMYLNASNQCFAQMHCKHSDSSCLLANYFGTIRGY